MTVLDEILVKRMIYTSASSIKGRGPIYLKKIIQRDIKNDKSGTRYYYKMDIKKYYHSIDHDLMKFCIRRYVKDKVLLPILDNFVDMLPEGLSIGLRSSQVFGNLLLNWLLDMSLKCKHRVKYYYRYCDDIVILSSSKGYLWNIHKLINLLLYGSKLSVKPNYLVTPLSNGLDFLGFVIYSGSYSRVRKRIKRNALFKLFRVKSKRRRNEVIASIKSYCVHSCGYKLFNKLVYGKKNIRG